MAVLRIFLSSQQPFGCRSGGFPRRGDRPEGPWGATLCAKLGLKLHPVRGVHGLTCRAGPFLHSQSNTNLYQLSLFVQNEIQHNKSGFRLCSLGWGGCRAKMFICVYVFYCAVVCSSDQEKRGQCVLLYELI